MSYNYGLLSGKYDSTKQRAVLLQGDRLRNYRRYNATLRMEMLIAGGVLVTDAQFYDGLYFAWMTEDKIKIDDTETQFDDFLKFIYNFSKKNKDREIFKIMQRKEEEDAISTQMFCKEFLFSSIESKELANFINEIGKDYSVFLPDDSQEKKELKSKIDEIIKKADSKYKLELNNPDNTLKRKDTNLLEYLENMENNISSIYQNIYNEEWEKFRNRIKHMFKGVYNDKIKPLIVRKWNGQFTYKSNLSETFDNEYTYQEKMESILKSFENLMKNINLSKKHFTLIRNETIKEFPIRSTIESEFNKILKLASNNLKDENKLNKAETFRLEYEKIFNDRYNKALAQQHFAKFIDVCDYNDKIITVIKNLKDALNIVKIRIDDSTIRKLGEMTWSNFNNIVSNDEIIKAYNDIYKSYDNKDVNAESFKLKLKEYIKLLEQKIEEVKLAKRDIENGPWNYHYTNMYELHNTFFSEIKPPSFVGGGSYREGEEANEICFFRETDKNTLYRIKIGDSVNDDKDNDFDTVIADVHNIFNGKEYIERIESYLTLMNQYKNVFDNSSGELEIITDREVIYREQKNLYKLADSKGHPHNWYDLGIIAQDKWVVVLRDLVKFSNGKYGGYIRVLNRNSQLQQSSKDVVILVKCKNLILLLKHFRHDDRKWHWECPRGFAENNLSCEENALKEIKEETNLTIINITQINKSDERVAYFLAECKDENINIDRTESIADSKFVNIEEFKRMVIDGLINDQYTIKAFMLAEMELLL